MSLETNRRDYSIDVFFAQICAAQKCAAHLEGRPLRSPEVRRPFTFRAARCIIADVAFEIISAQLSILDGAWQQAPDNLAIIDLGSGGGALYLVADVAGDTEGRDALARELIETARREYAAPRSPISLELADAVRAANEFFFNQNAALAPEARRIAGLTAVALRDDDLFVAQAGPGFTVLLRGAVLQHFPADSIWFDPTADLAQFPTPGAAPLGMRRAYTPDIFHVTLQPGDSILIATRALKNLLTDEELLDTLADRHPDDIVASLEDIAGVSDLAVIALRVNGAGALDAPMPRAEMPVEDAPMVPAPAMPAPIAMELPRDAEEIAAEPETAPTPRVNVRATLLNAAAKSGQAAASVAARVDWNALAGKIGRGLDALGRAAMRALAGALRVFLPGEPEADAQLRAATAPDAPAGWRMAAFVFPAILVLLGAGAWFVDRQDTQRRVLAQTTQLIEQSNGALENARRLEKTDKSGARQAAQSALALAEQARQLLPSNQAARNAYYAAQDMLDTVNGIAVVFLQAAFATLDPKSSAARLAIRWPEVYVLERGAAKVYRFIVDDVGSKAAPYGEASAGGVILKAGDKFADRTVSEIVDLFWNENSRVVALERSGIFLQYDPQSAKWTPRAASDAAKWKGATLASGYANNLYLLDPAANQILKYVPGADGSWSASTTYFSPGVSADLTGAADFAIDGDVWVLRANGALQRYNGGRAVEFTLRDLETRLVNPTALYTSASSASLYIADAGNRRIVQIDKVSGKFQRQFRPSGQFADAFNNLKALAVDETNRRFFIVNGNTAYLATIPQ